MLSLKGWGGGGGGGEGGCVVYLEFVCRLGDDGLLDDAGRGGGMKKYQMSSKS